MGTNCVPLVADLILFCYEENSMILFLSDNYQAGTESIRTHFNSYLSQFVLILVNSYSVFEQFVLVLLNYVNSYSFWSIRSKFGQFVLMPKKLMIYIRLLKVLDR